MVITMGKEYNAELAKRMYLYFASYDEEQGAPSFVKFARLSELTTADIESYREHEEFKRAYAECVEIRRDYLIDKALSKRFDSSLVKFLLAEEAKEVTNNEKCVEFTLRVIEDKLEN